MFILIHICITETVRHLLNQINYKAQVNTPQLSHPHPTSSPVTQGGVPLPLRICLWICVSLLSLSLSPVVPSCVVPSALLCPLFPPPFPAPAPQNSQNLFHLQRLFLPDLWLRPIPTNFFCLSPHPCVPGFLSLPCASTHWRPPPVARDPLTPPAAVLASPSPARSMKPQPVRVCGDLFRRHLRSSLLTVCAPEQCAPPGIRAPYEIGPRRKRGSPRRLGPRQGHRGTEPRSQGQLPRLHAARGFEQETTRRRTDPRPNCLSLPERTADPAPAGRRRGR